MSPGTAVSDALLDPFTRGRVADRLDLAALQGGNDQFQALPPPIHIEQGLGLIEDLVVSGGSGHGLTISPTRSPVRPSCHEVGTRSVPVRVIHSFPWREPATG